jgi:PAS domain S-box-containing protein
MPPASSEELGAALRPDLERALRESEDKFAQVFQASADAVAIADFPSGRITEVNDAYCRLIGYSREEAIGRSGNDLGSWAQASDREQFLSLLARDGAVREMEVVKLRRGGERLNCRLTSYRVDLGGRPCMLTRIRDITEQRAAEMALRESEEKFAKAFRAVPDAIAVSQLGDGRILDINAAYTGLLGYTRHEIVGRSVLDLNIWEEPALRGRIVARLRAGETVHNEPLVFRDKQGGLHRCLYFAEVTDIAGEPCLISILRDTTEQQRLEEQLRHAQKMESIGLLAGGVAHDFNNILTVIQGNVSLVLADPRLAPPLGEMLRQVQDAAQFAATLTRQLLVFSRRQVVQPGRLSLGATLQRVVALLQRTLGEHIVFRLEAAADLPDIHADEGMVEQVLLNLAVNARDAMPSGGEIAITTPLLEPDAEYLRRVPQARPGRFVGLRVRDTGVGIAPEVLPRIFDPFFTTKGEDRGTGLGLATVYGIAQQHHTWIEVASEVGRGTEFTVWFPRSAGRLDASRPRAGVADSPSGHETLLLVEDKDEVRAVVQGLLARKGYRVLAATDGPDALRLWAQHRGEIALLFTDVVMPGGINGRELAERLRTDRPSLKVVYCSGYDANILGGDTLAAPGTRFLAKPFDVAQAVRLVREMLDQPVA